jgi:hypothetical protein
MGRYHRRTKLQGEADTGIGMGWYSKCGKGQDFLGEMWIQEIAAGLVRYMEQRTGFYKERKIQEIAAGWYGTYGKGQDFLGERWIQEIAAGLVRYTEQRTLIYDVKLGPMGC